MKNKILSLVTLTALTSAAPLSADVYHGPSGTFSGVITAVEDERDSFTVENNDGIVKMFQVSPSRKSSLAAGSRVTVSYQDDYQWPLKTTSIQGGENMK